MRKGIDSRRYVRHRRRFDSVLALRDSAAPLTFVVTTVVTAVMPGVVFVVVVVVVVVVIVGAARAPRRRRCWFQTRPRCLLFPCARLVPSAVLECGVCCLVGW